MSASTAQSPSEFSNPNLEPLLTGEQIQTRIAEMGAEIARDCAGRNPLLIGVLKGAFVFLSDLVRAIDARVSTEFIAISSYGGGTRSSGVNKQERRLREVKIDYLGFDIPDAFVVGYGLDFAERYRNLPYIAVLKDPSQD
ncbi:MAG: hypothetical protein LC774_13980 [Acidobacteria bacterium]|nr:hypothetical protein [Acidobacteriota bacterium]